MDDLKALIVQALDLLIAHRTSHPVVETPGMTKLTLAALQVKGAMAWYESLGEIAQMAVRSQHNLKSSSTITTFYWSYKNENYRKPHSRSRAQRRYRGSRKAAVALPS